MANPLSPMAQNHGRGNHGCKYLALAVHPYLPVSTRHAGISWYGN